MVNFKGVWKIVAYCNSDFAGDKNTRTSVTGFCIYIRNCLISWKACSQKSVTLSSTKAEYVAVSEVCAEILFIKYLLEFLGVTIEYPITVMCDNVGAMFLSHNAKNSNQTKHVNICAHFVQQYVEDGWTTNRKDVRKNIWGSQINVTVRVWKLGEGNIYSTTVLFWVGLKKNIILHAYTYISLCTIF